MKKTYLIFYLAYLMFSLVYFYKTKKYWNHATKSDGTHPMLSTAYMFIAGSYLYMALTESQ